MISAISDVIAQIAPIVLMIALGTVVRTTGILRPESVEDLKKLVVNVALPAVLFIAFLDMDLEASYLGLFGTVLLVCLGMYGYGRLAQRVFRVKQEYFPFLVTGFEFGMVGITLFGTAYGLDQVGYIALVDLSHELFIWFVFVTMLTAKRDGVSGFGRTVRSFVQSPLIIAIVLALALNIAGVGPWIRSFPLTAAVTETLETVGDLLIPAILIIIGYGMRLSREGIRQAMGVVAVRLAVLLPLALLINEFVLNRLLQLDPAFHAAMFTFLVLPPPYIVPLFMKQELTEERTYINNVLSVYTVVSLLIFIAYFALNPTLG
jgi:hypothetical protein